MSFSGDNYNSLIKPNSLAHRKLEITNLAVSGTITGTATGNVPLPTSGTKQTGDVVQWDGNSWVFGGGGSLNTNHIHVGTFGAGTASAYMKMGTIAVQQGEVPYSDMGIAHSACFDATNAALIQRDNGLVQISSNNVDSNEIRLKTGGTSRLEIANLETTVYNNLTVNGTVTFDSGTGTVTFLSSKASNFAVNTMSALKTTPGEILGDLINEPISCQAYTLSGNTAVIQNTHASGYHTLSPSGQNIHNHLTTNYAAINHNHDSQYVPIPSGTPNTNDVIKWDGTNYVFEAASSGDQTFTGQASFTGQVTIGEVQGTSSPYFYCYRTAFMKSANFLGSVSIGAINLNHLFDVYATSTFNGDVTTTGNLTVSGTLTGTATGNVPIPTNTSFAGAAVLRNSTNTGWEYGTPQAPQASLNSDHVHSHYFSSGSWGHYMKMGFVSLDYDANGNELADVGIAHHENFTLTKVALMQRNNGLVQINSTGDVSTNSRITLKTGGTSRVDITNAQTTVSNFCYITGSSSQTLPRIEYKIINDQYGWWVAPSISAFSTSTSTTTPLSLRCNSGCYASTFYVSSDDRRKHNEAKFRDGDGLRIINKLQPVIYEKTAKLYEDGETRDPDEEFVIEAGFIAQRVLEVPELSFAVRGGDYVDENGETVTQEYALDYQAVWTVAVKAIQDLSAEVTQLKARVLELEGSP